MLKELKLAPYLEFYLNYRYYAIWRRCKEGQRAMKKQMESFKPHNDKTRLINTCKNQPGIKITNTINTVFNLKLKYHFKIICTYNTF